MRTFPFFLRVFLICLCGLATAALAAPAATKPMPNTLQVQVNVPPTWRPMLEDRVSEAFVSHLSDVFRQRGYAGEVVEVRSFDEPTPGCCLLMIDLNEWRMDPIGNINCSFTANLQTDHTIRHIPGIFSGMAIRWMGGPGRFGLADTFGDAAEDAIRQLYDAIAKTELVPGLRSR